MHLVKPSTQNKDHAVSVCKSHDCENIKNPAYYAPKISKGKMGMMRQLQPWPVSSLAMKIGQNSDHSTEWICALNKCTINQFYTHKECNEIWNCQCKAFFHLSHMEKINLLLNKSKTLSLNAIQFNSDKIKIQSYAGFFSDISGLKTMSVVMAMVGMFGASGTFDIVFFVTPELFPTNMR